MEFAMKNPASLIGYTICEIYVSWILRRNRLCRVHGMTHPTLNDDCLREYKAQYPNIA